ncbi:uncharacterized protein LOC134180986 isoform X2 [Corticium candelabrum]|uniref:uncharacterized protein LOC134180986 isoform X2 n=1 Tax=Corticium candelabrum TaxID=121492 RepID=UPI002E256936|nr:uncharacterized protein LOC134180986 isoform X2 [Corticium candelabrum]
MFLPVLTGLFLLQIWENKKSYGEETPQSVSIVWNPSGERFPYDENKVISVDIDAQLTLSCTSKLNESSIAKIYMVNETGFDLCSAEPAHRIRFQDITTLATQDDYLLQCRGPDRILDFANFIKWSFLSKHTFVGMFVYLIDVSNLTTFDGTKIQNEISGGACLYRGMKLKIILTDEKVPTTAAPTTEATETYENIGTKSDQGAEPTSGVITESQGNGGPEPTPTKQIKSPDEQKAKNSTCRQVSLSFLLVAVCLFMQLAG